MSGLRASRLALVTIWLMLLGGCAHTRSVGHSGTLHVALTEYRLNPERATASAGVLTIYVHNYGRLTHNLVISQNGQQTAATKPLYPGQSAVLALNLAPGSYSIASTILSDQDLGAYGTLTITP